MDHEPDAVTERVERHLQGLTKAMSVTAEPSEAPSSRNGSRRVLASVVVIAVVAIAAGAIWSAQREQPVALDTAVDPAGEGCLEGGAAAGDPAPTQVPDSVTMLGERSSDPAQPRPVPWGGELWSSSTDEATGTRTLARSVDGVNWTPADLDLDATLGLWVTVRGDCLVAVASSATEVVAASTVDGQTWNTAQVLDRPFVFSRLQASATHVFALVDTTPIPPNPDPLVDEFNRRLTERFGAFNGFSLTRQADGTYATTVTANDIAIFEGTLEELGADAATIDALTVAPDLSEAPATEPSSAPTSAAVDVFVTADAAAWNRTTIDLPGMPIGDTNLGLVVPTDDGVRVSADGASWETLAIPGSNFVRTLIDTDTGTWAVTGADVYRADNSEDAFHRIPLDVDLGEAVDLAAAPGSAAILIRGTGTLAPMPRVELVEEDATIDLRIPLPPDSQPYGWSLLARPDGSYLVASAVDLPGPDHPGEIASDEANEPGTWVLFEVSHQ